MLTKKCTCNETFNVGYKLIAEKVAENKCNELKCQKCSLQSSDWHVQEII